MSKLDILLAALVAIGCIIVGGILVGFANGDEEYEREQQIAFQTANAWMQERGLNGKADCKPAIFRSGYQCDIFTHDAVVLALWCHGRKKSVCQLWVTD